MGLLDARGGPDRIPGEERPLEPAHGSRADFSFRKIVSRWAADESSPPEWSRKRAAFYWTSPPSGRSAERAAASEEGPDQPSIALLFPMRSPHAAFADARINQRIDSLPCPAPFSMFPGRQARFPQDRPLASVAQVPRTRIPLKYNDGPAGRDCWLEYAGRAAARGEVEAGCG